MTPPSPVGVDMDDTTIRISCAQNGYIVEVTDPDITEDNQNADL